MRLRIELFCADLDATVAFYTGVLRFEVRADRRDEVPPYVSLTRGSVHIGVVPAWEDVERRCRDLPAGTEIVLEVEDLVAERDAVVAAGWQLLYDIQRQPWGLDDFRLHDPDGYYLRITT